MQIRKTIALTSFIALLSGGAFAAPANSVANMQNGSPVSLSGTVENFDSAKSFTLRDASGSVQVDLSKAPSVVLKNGDTVDVKGTVDKGIVSNSVIATSVAENKNIGQQIGETIDSVTGQDQASNATQVAVKSLPNSGLVKVQGTVDSVSNAQKFTLRDSTGTIDVSIKSGESASLQKGSGVTVVGYVNNGMLGKSIDATQVEVGR